MNLLWSSMLLLGIVYGALQGRMPEVTDGVIQASREAVVLAVSLVGVTGFWAGLMEIAKKAGVIDGLVKRMGPVMRFLFPEVPEDHSVMRAAGMNMICNDYFIIGLNKEPLTKRLYLVLFFVRETALTHQQIFYIWVISSAARLNGRTLPYSKSIAEKQSL